MSALRRLAIAACLMLGLLASATAGPATAATIPNVKLHGSHFDGTVQSVGPTGAYVRTADGVVMAPFDLAKFRMPHRRVQPSELRPGAAVEVEYRTMTGKVLGMQGDLVLFQPDKYPTSILVPNEYAHHTDVYAYLPSGRFARLKLDQALLMQNAQGVVILGTEAPSGYYGGPYYGYSYPYYDPYSYWDWPFYGWGGYPFFGGAYFYDFDHHGHFHGHFHHDHWATGGRPFVRGGGYRSGGHTGGFHGGGFHGGGFHRGGFHGGGSHGGGFHGGGFHGGGFHGGGGHSRR